MGTQKKKTCGFFGATCVFRKAGGKRLKKGTRIGSKRCGLCPNGRGRGSAGRYGKKKKNKKVSVQNGCWAAGEAFGGCIGGKWGRVPSTKEKRLRWEEKVLTTSQGLGKSNWSKGARKEWTSKKTVLCNGEGVRREVCFQKNKSRRGQGRQNKKVRTEVEPSSTVRWDVDGKIWSR